MMSGVVDFLKLPDLVQFLVLIQTDLVAEKAVCFKVVSRSRTWRENNSFGPRKSTAPANHPSSCLCELCVVQPTSKPRDLFRCPNCRGSERNCGNVGTCWTFPINIFLVSKHIHALATTVFFSRNRFVLWENSFPPSLEGGREDSEFVYLDLTLRRMRQMPLASIRSLQFDLQTFCATEDRKDGRCYKLWVDLAELIKSTIPAGRLTWTIDFSSLNSDYFGGRSSGPQATWEAYQNIVAAFQFKEPFFRDFFLHLASPRGSYDKDLIRWNREHTLEKLVMNNKEYDSALRGKYSQRYLDESAGPRMYFHEYLANVTDIHPLKCHDKEVRESILDGSINDGEFDDYIVDEDF